MPPLLLSSSIDYAPYAWWRSRLLVDYRAPRNPFGDSTEFEEGRVDSVVLVHLATALHVGPGQFQVGVRNLLNTKYFSIPSEASNIGFLWIPAEGTRITMAYSVKW